MDSVDGDTAIDENASGEDLARRTDKYWQLANLGPPRISSTWSNLGRISASSLARQARLWIEWYSPRSRSSVRKFLNSGDHLGSLLHLNLRIVPQSLVPLALDKRQNALGRHLLQLAIGDSSEPSFTAKVRLDSGVRSCSRSIRR
ncbi:hypothetical protein DTO169E5_4288 [Paecilomyces variotii]|nr:hypothetical protein DTO169E5_4288 [Paecilomyces variotii]KAJ9384436.1 hypothetical protein DTO063F5_4740 [Paecilomyces variotii]